MLKKLRLKFIVIILSLVSLMMWIMFSMTVHMTKANLEESSLRAMQQAGSFSAVFSDRLERPSGGERQSIPCFFLIRHSSGAFMATGSPGVSLPDNEVLQEIWDAAEAQPDSTGVLKEYSLRFIRERAPMGTRYIFADISHEQLAINILYRNCAIIGSVFFLLFIPLSILLANWAIKPVERAWQQQRQFVADASHELKTPLTVIMTNSELLLSPGQDESARQRFAGSIQSTAQQMRHLVEGLLELARADNTVTTLTKETVDLSQLAESCVLPFEAVFFEKDLLLDCQLTAGITVQGDAVKLKQVLDILLDNAQKYADPGTVHVRLASQGKHCLFSIRTPGDPISKADLTNIFRRFYRIDTARSRNGSYGLGLSIAQHIVQSHKGKIWAESGDGCNTFFVQLPLISSSKGENP